MTTTIDLTKATLLLLEHFGTRYDASRLGGRSKMAGVLGAECDLSGQEAAEWLDALEQAGAIRWIPQPGAGWMQRQHRLEIELGYWKLERSQ